MHYAYNVDFDFIGVRFRILNRQHYPQRIAPEFRLLRGVFDTAPIMG